MALLLNRKYGSRLECIYYILQSLYAKYNTTKEFKLGDIKFDEEDINNVHHFCQLLLSLPILNRKCCPYLDNKERLCGESRPRDRVNPSGDCRKMTQLGLAPRPVQELARTCRRRSTAWHKDKSL